MEITDSGALRPSLLMFQIGAALSICSNLTKDFATQTNASMKLQNNM